MQLDCIDYACRALEQCIQLDPYLSVAYFVYGCLLFDQAKYQDALDHFDHALVVRYSYYYISMIKCTSF